MMTDIIISPSKPLRITLHILFWIIVLLSYTLFYGRMSGSIYPSFMHLAVTFPLYIAATYFSIYYIIPHFLLQKKYKTLFISSFYLLMGTAFLEIFITILFITSPIDINLIEKASPLNAKSLDIFLRLLGIYIVVFFASSIKLVKHWYAIQIKNQLLLKEKLEAELNFLKSQVNPHFLFNTLNSLYALTLKKSDESPAVVLKLSGILDYMLYHSNRDYVSLSKEIELINNYIELEKLRYGSRLEVSFTISGFTQRKTIAPMLIFPLVENSFKHGAGKSSKSSWINLSLVLKLNHLTFTAENSKNPAPKNIGSHGIGLSNLRKRLNLLYNEKYNLDIKDRSDSFFVKLELTLDEKTGEEENEN